ncbi:MAG: hypothetical protein GY751_06540 [Bacteroidetes bacterium]|nr:hypothetical protein [Bacteroidota bacterium]
MKQLLTLTLLIMISGSISAQYQDGFQIEHFFGWGPDPKTDAMGQSDVAVGGSVASMFRNPAGIGLIENAEFDFSSSGHFYALKMSDYFFTGAAYRVHDRVVAAFSHNIFAVGETTFDITFGSNKYPLDKARISNLALSVAGEAVKNLHIGLNFNYLRWKYIEEVKVAHAFHMDAGLLYTIFFGGEKDHQGIRIGASVTNVTKGRIKFLSPIGEKGDEVMPITGRYGVTYFNKQLIKKTSSNGHSFLGLLATFEAMDLINSDFGTTFRIGTEFTVYEILAVRFGYLTEKKDDGGFAVNFTRRKGITYGFGLIVPVSELSKGKVPVNIHFDYASFNQPRSSTIGGYLSNMRSFGLKAVFTMNHLNKSTNH